MPHPNDDFLNQFGYTDPAIRRYLPGKKDIVKNYNELKNQDHSKLNESVSNKVGALFEKGIKKPLFENKIDSSNKNWKLVNTPHGIFYFNSITNEWMNSFGKIANSLEDLIFFNNLDFYSDGDYSKQTIVSFFSDDGSYVGLLEDNLLKLYSASYSPTIEFTLEKSVSIPIGFSGTDNQKCLISNDGNYIIFSLPSNKSVYFVNANTNHILQTITEDIPNFGSLIAADKDFLGLAISTNNLTRDPSIYDTRAVSYGASSLVCYYKRNYQSVNAQKFKKIHTTHAQMVFKKSGVDGQSFLRQFTSYNNPTLSSLERESSTIVDCGVFRFDDLKCKNYSFASSTLALREDQINYKSSFINAYSPRYLPANAPGWTFANAVTNNFQKQVVYDNLDFPFYDFHLPPTDDYLIENFELTTLPGVKQFTIINKVNNQYYEDKSYLRLNPTLPIIFGKNISDIRLYNPSGLTFFNENIVGSFAEKSFIRGSLILFNQNNEVPSSSPNLYNIKPFINEEVLNTKIGINDTHTYHVSQILTGVTGENIKNIRVYRTYNMAENNIDSFQYQDWNKSTANSLATPTPNINDSGLIKIMYSSDKSSLLESTFFNNSTMSNNYKIRIGVVATKPYLQNPSNCPNSEFAYPISTNILDDTITSIFVSNNFVFINFNNQTLLFSINNNLSYKPLIFEKSFSESLKDYNFTYNNTGEFFSKNNKIYKYDTSSKNLILIGEL